MRVSHNCPNGSLWRKWDLHIHAPGTKKNDQYKLADGGSSLDAFCDRLEQSDVAAFGVTDYFSADSYFAVVKRFKEKYPDSEKVLFPNIELATSDVVNTANEEVNLHLIFNPFDPTFEKNVRDFIYRLNTHKTEGSGGKRITASELKTESDFQEASTSREWIKKALGEVFGSEADLSDHVLIVAAANNDGIRAKRGVKRKALISDEVDKFCNGFFGNSGNTDYFLDPKRLEDGSTTGPKPVISGSDAHSFSDLDSSLGKLVLKDGEPIKEPTWIKADVTYEGLKQIIFEPAGRVFIGEEPNVLARVRENPRRYISLLHIDHVQGYDGGYGRWFKEEEIPLNKELVAIIGNKGNGKSAVTDIIGLLGNSHNQKYERENRSEELFSFLNRDKFLRGNCASHFEAEMRWHAGAPDKAVLDHQIDINLPENVEYLPQKYLEKLCANIEDDEFRHKLNEVIFEYVPEDKRYGTHTLEDLITYRTNQRAAEIRVAKDKLHDANLKVVSIEKKLVPDYQKELEQKLKLREADMAAHEETRPKVVAEPAEGGADAAKSAEEIAVIDKAVKELDQKIAEAQTESSALSKSAEDLRQARQSIERQVRTVTSLKSKYETLLSAEGIAFEDIVVVQESYGKLDAVLKTKEARVRELEDLLRDAAHIAALGLGVKEAKTAEEKSLFCQRATFESKRKEITDTLDKPNREYQAYLVAETQWQARKTALEGDAQSPTPDTLNWLKQELEAVTTKFPEDLRLARQERITAAKEVFVKKKSLIEFYNSVKQSIDDEIKMYGTDLGEYNISIEASLRFDPLFYEDFLRQINQQVKGSFHGTDDGRTILKQIVAVVPKWEDEGGVIKALEMIDDYLHNDRRQSQGTDVARDVFKQMRGQKNPVVDLYDYLFGFDYLETKYDLKIDGKDLRELSAGERGGLLLIFYLMLDKRDVPLVIDQPEDNLDNKSVYEILVAFLKKAKKRRQIIMVTHNPNLAVVADAEQIIHVSIDKKHSVNDFTFQAGAIENPVINKAVVDILEGTLPAFDNRRLKYRRQRA